MTSDLMEVEAAGSGSDVCFLQNGILLKKSYEWSQRLSDEDF